MGSTEELVRLFASCEISQEEMCHRKHLRIALWFARHYPPEEAIYRVRTGLQKWLLTHGKPAEAYCEATTRFWMNLASEFAARADPLESEGAVEAAFLEAARAYPSKPVAHAADAPAAADS